MTGLATMDATSAFSHAASARRRAALARRLRRFGRAAADDGRLAVYDERTARRGASVAGGVAEIPLDAITGTLEPSRAAAFDSRFRPAAVARSRWERVWLAEQRGVALPPISVVPVAGGYAVRDGHHRISVARARGALTIDAVVDTALAPAV